MELMGCVLLIGLGIVISICLRVRINWETIEIRNFYFGSNEAIVGHSSRSRIPLPSLKYRAEFGRTINYITTDHTNDKARYPETAVSTAFHVNLYNLLHFRPEKCKSTAPDAALRWPGDQRIYFFKNKRIHRYAETAQTVDHIFDLKIKEMNKIDAALTVNTTTLLFKDCHVWEYTVSWFGEEKEPKWQLSEKMHINKKYPGLPCNIDAAMSMYGRQYFFKGCLYYEVSDNDKSKPEQELNAGHEMGYIVDDFEHTSEFSKIISGKNYEEESSHSSHSVHNRKEKLEIDKLREKSLKLDPNRDLEISSAKPDLHSPSSNFNYNRYYVSKAQDIYDWGLPCDIDAALTWNSWTSYFYKDGYYFRWHENKLSGARSLMHWNIDMVECE